MKKVLFVMILCVIGTFLYAKGDIEKPLEDKPIVITFAHMNAVGDLIDQTAQEFKRIVESKTDNVEVRVHPAGQLGDGKQNFEGLKFGTINMTMTDPDMLSNFVPEFVVFALPYMFKDWEHVERVMDSEVGESLNKILIDKQDVRILGWMHNGFRNMVTVNKEIKTISDFSGMKFRSPEILVYVEMFKAIGATPTPLPWPEVYQAMKTRIVDGMETTPTGMVGTRVWEVGKYVVKTNHLYTGANIVISEKFYQSLPSNVQTAITEAMEEIVPWQRSMIYNDSLSTIKLLQDNGMTILNIDTTPLSEACAPVWDKLTKNAPEAKQFINKITDLR